MLVSMNPDTVELITLQGLIAAFEICSDPQVCNHLAMSIKHFSSPSQWQEFRYTYNL